MRPQRDVDQSRTSATVAGARLRRLAGVLAVVAAALVGPSIAQAATHLNVLTVIPNTRAGDVFQVQVEALNSPTGPRDTAFTGTITINAAAAGGSTFASGNTQTANQGLATFNVSLVNAASSYQVSAASSGLTGDTSNLFNVTARTLVVNTVSDVRAGDLFTVQVQAFDAQAVPQLAENYNGSISLTANVPTGGSGFAAAPSPLGAFAGTATFSNLQLLNAANGYTTTASGTSGASPAASPNSGTSNAFSATARTLVVGNVPNVRAGDLFAVTVTARDAQATPQVAENYDGTVSLALNVPAGGSGFAGGAPGAQGATAGSVTFSNLQLLNAASGYTVTASGTSPAPPAAAPNSGTSNPFHATARTLVLSGAVANVRAGDPFSVQVQAFDAQATPQLAENYNGTVTLNANAPAGGSPFAATPSQSAIAGTASFSGLQLLNAANGYTLTASGTTGGSPAAAPIGGTSNSFSVTARSLAPNAVANVRAGDVFSVTFTARDAQPTPQVAENFDASVSLTLNVPAGGSGFAGGAPGAQNATSGSVTFSNLQLLNAASGYSVTPATTSGAPPAAAPNIGTSNSFHATARTLVTGAVSNVRAGDSFSVTVSAFDAQATPQTAENYNGTVSLTANAPAGGSGFAASLSQTATAGTASFTAALPNAANGYTITATGTSGASPAANPISGTSNSFNVTARVLVFDAIPDRRAGDPFSVTVTARDAQPTPQVAENFSGTVSVFSNPPAGGSGFTGGAPTPQSASGGPVTFNGLRLPNAADGYTLTASSPGLAGTSNAFAVSARSLSITTPVGNTRAGDPFNLTVQAFDAQPTPQVAENFDESVSLVANHTPDGSGFASPVSQNAAGGTASFSGLQLLDAANGYSIGASGDGLVAPPTPSFAVTARSLVMAPFGDLKSGEPFSVAVSAMDAQATPRVAENFGGSIALGLDVPSGGASFAVAPAPKAASNGVVTFDGLSLLDAANGYRLEANATGLVPVSRLFDVRASRLVFVAPSSDKVAGQTFSVQLQARDERNNLAENFVGAVQLSASAPGGSTNFAGGTATANGVGGVVSFGGLKLDLAAGNYSLSANAGELSAQSAPFAVVAAMVSRTLTLKLSGRLVASGVLRAGPGPLCGSGMLVRIQRRTSRGWVTVGSDRTNQAGAYSKRIANRRGTYRAMAPSATLPSPTTVCGAATSRTRVKG
jgi:ribosomal protein S28E/S33